MDYPKININIIKIIDVLAQGKAYFNELHEKTKIKSKNNLLKNLNILTENKIVFKESNKSNTYYSLNYSNSILIAILNLINKSKFEKLPFIVKKSIIDSIFTLKPRIAVLFGSFARGNNNINSDIDLIFFDASNKKAVYEISRNYEVKINVVFMKFKELDILNESLKHILKTGYPLIGEEYFYNETKKI